MASSHDPSSDTPSRTPSRKPNYTIEDDKHLCSVYMDISQDAEVGIYQKRESFWNRIEELYNLKKRPAMSERSNRSLETRMQIILSSVSKFKGCVQQVEYQHPSGCSEADIVRSYIKFVYFLYILLLLTYFILYAATKGKRYDEARPKV